MDERQIAILRLLDGPDHRRLEDEDKEEALVSIKAAHR
jgi:hypothetical protein